MALGHKVFLQSVIEKLEWLMSYNLLRKPGRSQGMVEYDPFYNTSSYLGKLGISVKDSRKGCLAHEDIFF